MSIVSLLACVTMLIGTTFAWFTDSVTSANNIIKSGNLDVEMYWAEGSQSVPTNDDEWNDASTGAIFDYSLWEPGFVQVRHIKIANKGTLDLKYKVSILANGEVSDLTDVIDVYYVDPATRVVDRASLTNLPKVGTLSEVLAKFGETGNGKLLAGEADTITLAFKMQESAGNDYQNKSIGTDFSVVLNATQLASEFDSFDNQYDVDAVNPTYVSTAKEFIDVLSDIRNDAKQQIPGATGNKSYRVEANIVLTDDIVIDSSDDFMYTDGNGAAFHLYGMKGTLDLNGNTIKVESESLLNGKTSANAVLLIQYSNVIIKGEGNVIAENKSIPVYAWANCTVDIYGGNYVTNAYERNESAVYVNNASALVNVYGGTYTNSKYAFNTHDTSCAGTPVIILHEGITYADFLKNGTVNVIQSDINGGRIVVADGCEIQQFNDNGITMNKVVTK